MPGGAYGGVRVVAPGGGRNQLKPVMRVLTDKVTGVRHHDNARHVAAVIFRTLYVAHADGYARLLLHQFARLNGR